MFNKLCIHILKQVWVCAFCYSKVALYVTVCLVFFQTHFKIDFLDDVVDPRQITVDVLGPEGERIDSVSYTHLDVYKRQALQRMPGTR